MTQREETQSRCERVVVTGAAGALGSVVTDRFAGAGVEVIGIDVDYGGVEGLDADPEREGCWRLEVDLSETGAIEAARERIADELGPVDGLVHCAGGFRFAEIHEASDDDIGFLVDANLRSSLLVVREWMREMREREFGRVVLMSSASTRAPSAGEGPYASTKAALDALVDAVADEIAALDITINAIQPSVIDTPANREAMPDADFDTWVKREQIAEIIFSLTQPYGDPINGAHITVRGRT